MLHSQGVQDGNQTSRGVSRRSVIRAAIMTVPIVTSLTLARSGIASANSRNNVATAALNAASAPAIGILNAVSADVNDFILGLTVPDASNTGVPAGTPLTPVNGKVTVTTAGAAYSGIRFNGNVVVRAPDVSFTNCWFAGGFNSPTGQVGLLHCQTGSKNTQIVRCTIAAQTPGFYQNGILGHDFTARRCNIYDVVDCIDPFQSDDNTLPVNVRIEGCYLHDLSYFSPSPTNSDNRTHNDCVQYQGGSNFQIVGSRLDAFYNPSVGQASSSTGNPAGYPHLWSAGAAVMIKPDVGPISDFKITDCWLNGGAACINVANRTTNPARSIGGGGQIVRNRFGRDIRLSQGASVYAVLMPSTVAIYTGEGTIDQNVYADSGYPVTVRHNGG